MLRWLAATGNNSIFDSGCLGYKAVLAFDAVAIVGLVELWWVDTVLKTSQGWPRVKTAHLDNNRSAGMVIPPASRPPSISDSMSRVACTTVTWSAFSRVPSLKDFPVVQNKAFSAVASADFECHVVVQELVYFLSCRQGNQPTHVSGR
jgi:hypothetical protein